MKNVKKDIIYFYLINVKKLFLLKIVLNMIIHLMKLYVYNVMMIILLIINYVNYDKIKLMSANN